MESTSRSWRQGWCALSLGILFLLCLTLHIHAGVTNPIPWSDSFEQYDHGQRIDGTNGWSGADDEDNLRVFTTNNPYLGQWPLNDTRTNLLSITAVTTNKVSDAEAWLEHDIHIDMLMQPTRWTEDEPPIATNNAQMAMYVNSNGHITTWCSSFDQFFTLQDPQWVTLGHTPISSGAWMRVTLSLQYDADFSGANFFKIRVNNSLDLTNRFAQTSPNAFGSSNGSWFVMAHQGNWFVSEVEFSGHTYVDDFVVTNDMPSTDTVHIVHATHETGGILDPDAEYVPVLQGSDLKFDISEAQGYDLTNVAWGVTQDPAERTNFRGVVASHTFSNVMNDYSIRVFTRPEKRTFAVPFPDYGIASPVGTNVYDYNTSISAGIAGSPMDMGSGTQRAVTGWTRYTDSGVTNSGAGTNFVFSIQGVNTGDWTTATWHWNIQYMLSTSNDGPGFLNVGDGWKNENTVLGIRATASEFGYRHDSWSGDTNGATFADNVITVAMDRARDIVAHYVQETYAPKGTPIAYLEKYGLTNGPPYWYSSSGAAEDDDPDLDTLMTWEEFIAGTVPTNYFSVFEILDVGHGSPSNVVVFYGTTNSGVYLPFGMYRSTNLLGSPVWDLVTDSIPRADDGTNEWWDTDLPSNGVAFYAPVATNLPPE